MAWAGMAGLLLASVEQGSSSMPTNGCISGGVPMVVACQLWQLRRWQHGNKVNEYNDNNMTITEQPTQ
jgi:hypothetical protein